MAPALVTYRARVGMIFSRALSVVLVGPEVADLVEVEVFYQEEFCSDHLNNKFHGLREIIMPG